ncbi:MAG: hypothetical protein LBT06_10695 [Hungatella sp.]|jgi:hypothetical protein|nr:hypothetical protein [Hungatella sp.]
MSKDLRIFCIKHGIDLDELGPVGEISDGSHTFNDLYHQRAVLFAVLCNIFPNYSWKSWRHHDGEKCFGADDWFIVGIETPEGQYTYHYEKKYWDMFKCQEVDQAPEWDRHTDKDVKRLLSLGAVHIGVDLAHSENMTNSPDSVSIINCYITNNYSPLGGRVWEEQKEEEKND